MHALRRHRTRAARRAEAAVRLRIADITSLEREWPIAIVKIERHVECPTCDGGKRAVRRGLVLIECPNCAGHGVVPKEEP